MDIIRQKGLCYKCLAGGHISRECRNSKPCFLCKTPGHHSALCKNKGNGSSGMLHSSTGDGRVERRDCQDPEERGGENGSSLTSNITALNYGKGVVYMQMAVVTLVAPGNQTVRARMLFDSGSTCSFITTKLQRQLRLQIEGRFDLSNAKFEDTERRVKSYPIVTLELPVSGGSEIVSMSLFVTEQISCSIQKQPLDRAWFSQFKGLTLADTVSSETEFHEVDILIGSDHYFDIVRDHVIRLENGLVLVDSKLGYIPSGRMRSPSCQKLNPCLFVSCFLNSGIREESMLHIGKIEIFWKLEDIGIKDDAITPDDDLAVEKFEQSVQEVDNRITVGWPWKSSHPVLPENRDLALGRLPHLLRRIQGKPDVIGEYDAVIKDQLKRGMVEVVPDESKHDGPVHYLPHHEVIRIDHSTTKLRVAYDGSAKRSKGEPSLNDCLLCGPVLLGDLCGLLLRFRMNAVAFTADIEKAYLQVGLHEADRDVTRFLWPRNINNPPDPNNLVVYRFSRVLFGIISSAFLLDAAIRYKMRTVASPVSLAIAKNTYVDNLINGTSTSSKAVEFYNEAVQLFEEISMNLRAWRSNSEQLNAEIPEDKKAKQSDTKVLGLQWDCVTDEIGFQNPRMSKATVVTKRNLLQAGSKLFDPCGLLSPITIRIKLLTQKLWQQKINWDSRIPDDVLAAWRVVSEQVDSASDIRLPSFLAISPTNFELHAFCDASAKVFAAVIYMRATVPPYETKLLMSKARLAPVKAPSIPRLELMAVVIVVPLLAFVERQLQVQPSDRFVWSDSKCVLHWLKSVKVLSVFVENRVREINESGMRCRYVPTEVNPADLPTKGIDSTELKESELWWKGPQFLRRGQIGWPPDDIPDTMPVNVEFESEVRVAIADFDSAKVPFDIDLSRFRTLEVLLCTTAWATRFVASLKAGRTGHSSSKTKYLSLLERQDALLLWVVYLQRSFRSDDTKWRNLKKQLELFCDESGLWRCGGRCVMQR